VVADKRETKSIKEVFGEKAYSIPISSIKSMIGQPLSSAGCLQLITALIAINENFIPPTINYEYPDPECDLDYVPNKYREVKVNTALINSFGMGGNNVSIIVGKSNGRKYINHSN
jgi:3-oxoacyl-[acyl-carrier-protein] synthase II